MVHKLRIAIFGLLIVSGSIVARDEASLVSKLANQVRHVKNMTGNLLLPQGHFSSYVESYNLVQDYAQFVQQHHQKFLLDCVQSFANNPEFIGIARYLQVTQDARGSLYLEPTRLFSNIMNKQKGLAEGELQKRAVEFLADSHMLETSYHAAQAATRYPRICKRFYANITK